MKITIKSSYNLLRLNNSSTWPQAKSSYRRLVQLWHPDKFDDSSDEYVNAHHNFLEITKAFELLQAYYKKNKKLPFEKHIPSADSENCIENFSLSRKNPSTGRKARSIRVRTRSKAPLVIGMVLLIYLAYNSSNSSFISSKTSQPSVLNSSSKLIPSTGTMLGTSARTGLGRKRHFEYSGTGVGEVIGNRFNQTKR